jgi:integrase
MPLEIKWDRSPWWYGRYKRDGKKLCVKLDVRVEGTPPASRRLSDQGDTAFEKSRAKAELRFAQFVEDLQGPQSKEDLVKRLISIRQGGKMETVPLSEMFNVWSALPRKKPLGERYVFQVNRRFQLFASFVTKHQPQAKTMADVSVETAEAFVNAERAKGYAAKTYNDLLILLRSVFERLKKRATLMHNPFENIPLSDGDTMGQTPFMPDELALIVTSARKPEHALIRPILFTGICTAMRRGDCCLLKWSDVDLQNRVITVKTSKTGRTAVIPLFPLLEEEIRRHLPAKNDFVFPEPAKRYIGNPDYITDLADRVLKDAGYFDSSSSGTSSTHRGNLRASRAHGLRKARLHGLHSFRVTWVTLALTAGVPIELVRLVTSHQSVEIVLKHYFRPGREEMRRILTEKMPQLFSRTDAANAEDEKKAPATPPGIKALIESMTAENWAEVRGALLKRLEQEPPNAA